MPRLVYSKKRMKADSLAIIQVANAICAEYAAQGYDLTLRQLYYQFVARDVIPNRQAEYNRLGRVVSDARLCGLMDWDYIVDRTRNLKQRTHWDSPAEVLKAAARGYITDKWRNQEVRIEVWVEKEALAGVIERIATELDVPFFSCRGYVSQSEMWRASQRVYNHVLDGQKVIILHLGDHDPSGIDMTRDITDRLFTFAGRDLLEARHYGMRSRLTFDEFEEDVEVRRIALNMDQVQQYDPPPNPAKLTDSRSGDYMARYGNSSWELDALPPDVLADLIRQHVEAERDDEVWESTVAQENTERERILAVARDFSNT